MITADEFTVWLSDDNADPAVLIEADYVDDLGAPGTVYVANEVYPGPGEVSSSNIYHEVANGDIAIVSRLDRTTVGQVQLVDDSEITDWLDWIWRGQPIKFYLGDRTWDRSDFRLQIDAINGGIRSLRSNKMAWTIFDLSETLNIEVGSETAPICLGKTFNIKPVLIDAVLRKFKVHDGAVTSIVVRDNGVVIAPTLNLASGEFTLLVAAAGEITADVVQVDQSAADMIDKLCGDNGVSVNATNLSEFSNTDTLGYYIDKPTILEKVIREIMATVGGSYRFNLVGELEMWRLEAPGTATTTITPDDIQLDGLAQRLTEYPVNTLTLGYKRNWQVQSADSLATVLTTQQRSDYSTDYQIVSSSNVLTDYPLSNDERKNTLFFDQADAQAEADRRADLKDTKRQTNKAKCFLSAAEVIDGETIELSYPGLGFATGRDVVVIGRRRILGARRIELTVWS